MRQHRRLLATTDRSVLATSQTACVRILAQRSAYHSTAIGRVLGDVNGKFPSFLHLSQVSSTVISVAIKALPSICLDKLEHLQPSNTPTYAGEIETTMKNQILMLLIVCWLAVFTSLLITFWLEPTSHNQKFQQSENKEA